MGLVIRCCRRCKRLFCWQWYPTPHFHLKKQGIFDSRNQIGSRVYSGNWIDPNNNWLWVLEGYGFAENGGGTLRDVWVYDVEKNMWAQMCEENIGNKEQKPVGVDSFLMPWARGQLSVAQINSSFAYMYGGVDFEFIYYGDLWRIEWNKINCTASSVVSSTTTTGIEPAMLESNKTKDNSAVVAVAVVIPLFFVLLGGMTLAFILWKRRRAQYYIFLVLFCLFQVKWHRKLLLNWQQLHHKRCKEQVWIQHTKFSIEKHLLLLLHCKK